MDVEKESELKYYAQRTNYLEGGVMITGKAPSKTERKQTSRKQLAATRKQLLSEVKESSKLPPENMLPKAPPCDNIATKSPSSDNASVGTVKNESQRRLDALKRLTECTTGKEGTPAKRTRRSKKAASRVIWSWKGNLQNALPGCEVIEQEKVEEMITRFQYVTEQESSFCCILNDGSLSYQVFSDS